MLLNLTRSNFDLKNYKKNSVQVVTLLILPTELNSI